MIRDNGSLHFIYVCTFTTTKVYKIKTINFRKITDRNFTGYKRVATS